jgi:hypothetical protein
MSGRKGLWSAGRVKMPVCETGVGGPFGVGVGIGAERAGRARLRARRSGRYIFAVWCVSLDEHLV